VRSINCLIVDVFGNKLLDILSLPLRSHVANTVDGSKLEVVVVN